MTSLLTWRYGGRVFCASIAAAATLSAQMAQAVSTHAHAHAHSTAGLSEVVDNDAGVFGASSDAPATVPGVHAHAWAWADVGFFNIRKGGGGHHWFTEGFAPKHAWWHWWAFSGAFVIDGPAGETASIGLVLPAAGTVEDQGMPNPDDPDEKPPFPIPDPRSQTFYVDSFFDVFAEVDAQLINNRDGSSHQLFDGGLMVGPGQKIEGRGDLAGAVRPVQGDLPPGIMGAEIGQDVMPTQKVAQAPTGAILESLLRVRGAQNAPLDSENVPEPGPAPEGSMFAAMSLVSDMRILGDTGERFKIRALPPGDATGDSMVDAFDLAAASPKFNKGPSDAMWVEGDWDQDDDVDPFDLAEASPFFNAGPPPADAATSGALGDGNPSVIYDASNGHFLLDPDGFAGIDTFILSSASGIFDNLAPVMPGATFFTTDTDLIVAQNFFAPALGLPMHDLGAIADAGLTEGFLLGDLTLLFGKSGSPNITPDLVVIPEPASLLMLSVVGLISLRRRRAA